MQYVSKILRASAKLKSFWIIIIKSAPLQMWAEQKKKTFRESIGGHLNIC